VTDSICFDEKGLVPVIAQEAGTREVLMLAYMNREALEKTLATKKMHYFSRSRQTLWLKGETSGHFQTLRELRYDCDADTLLAVVEQAGAACHTGHKTCFYRQMHPVEDYPADAYPGDCPDNCPSDRPDPLKRLYAVIADRKAHPQEGSYTNALLDSGVDKILKKVGEESAEVIIAAKNGAKDEIVYETADLLYHLCVALFYTGVSWDSVYAALEKRRGKTKSEYTLE
jgi:phosphoribosyl-ATP pyrophosphohydrolase/phosphoribosyl-AMP cyclohydrolase